MRTARRSRWRYTLQCCRNCRDRRIKCDAGLPACRNCVRRSATCAGYSVWEVHVKPRSLEAPTVGQMSDYEPLYKPVPAIPTLQFTASPALCMFLPDMDDAARHAFDYFRFQAYQDYKSRGYPVLWADQALSSAINEPSVFFALAAGGAAEQAITEHVHATLARSTYRHQGDIAMHLYSKALRHLQLPMQKAIFGQGSLTPIILGCLIFVIYETTFGTHLNAMRHARTGFNILEERLQLSVVRQDTSFACKKSTLSSRSTDSLAKSVLSKSGVSGALGGFSWSGVSKSSLEEMQRRLEVLMEACEGIRTQLQALARERISRVSALGIQPDTSCLVYTISRIVEVDPAFQVQMASVLKGFRMLSQDLRLALASTKYRSLEPSLLFMQTRCFHASLSLATSRGLNEKLTDVFEHDVGRTLDSTEQLIRLSFMGDEQIDGSARTGPIADEFMDKLLAAEHPRLGSMSNSRVKQGPLPLVQRVNKVVAGIFEFGILPALYLIACKCREPLHRRRAARLLREANRVEAINSSAILAAYADAITHIEEQSALEGLGCGDQKCSSDSFPKFCSDELPKTARFLDVVVATAGSKSGATNHQCPSHLDMTCTRLVEEDGDDIAMIKYRYDLETRQYDVVEIATFLAREFASGNS